MCSQLMVHRLPRHHSEHSFYFLINPRSNLPWSLWWQTRNSPVRHVLRLRVQKTSYWGIGLVLELAQKKSWPEQFGTPVTIHSVSDMYVKRYENAYTACCVRQLSWNLNCCPWKNSCHKTINEGHHHWSFVFKNHNYLLLLESCQDKPSIDEVLIRPSKNRLLYVEKLIAISARISRCCGSWVQCREIIVRTAR